METGRILIIRNEKQKIRNEKIGESDKMKSVVTILFIILLIVGLTYGLGSCKKNENLNNLTPLAQVIPDGFPQPVYRFTDNPLTKEGFELGRRLFYDGRLSVDGVHPCSSCHQQIAAFGTF